MILDRKPLVLDDSAQTQQLQATDDLDIPLEQRHQVLRAQFDLLVRVLVGQGIALPSELLGE